MALEVAQLEEGAEPCLKPDWVRLPGRIGNALVAIITIVEEEHTAVRERGEFHELVGATPYLRRADREVRSINNVGVVLNPQTGKLVTMTMAAPEVNKVDRKAAEFRRLRDLLIHEWDPIGVGHLASAQDEYDAYVPALYELLSSGAHLGKIVGYLNWLETEQLGLPGSRCEIERFARLLVEFGEQFKRET